jgi:hypothetical protein
MLPAKARVSALVRAHRIFLLGLMSGLVLQTGVAVALSAHEGGTATGQSAISARPTMSITPGVRPKVQGRPPATVDSAAPKPALTKPPAKPAPKPKPKARRPAKSFKRWIPTGTGMWLYQWPQTEGGKASHIVTRAKQVGLTHIFVRTGTLKGGFDGGPALRKLLPATRGKHLKVVAWDFPKLNNPEADARRLAAAATFSVPGKKNPHVAAVAPDIETASEGTNLTGARVSLYYRTLRKLLPRHIAILATVPWPSEHRVGKYPYDVTARYVDAFVPMAYWINRDPATVARQSVKFFKRYKKPVLPVGQAYDPDIDRPGIGLSTPSAGQILAFARAAKAAGAQSASLWVWQTTNREQWAAWRRARVYFAPPRPKKAAKPVRAKPSGAARQRPIRRD